MLTCACNRRAPSNLVPPPPPVHTSVGSWVSSPCGRCLRQVLSFSVRVGSPLRLCNRAPPAVNHISQPAFSAWDGLGDTIKLSLTEVPEKERDLCRRLANLGMRGTELQKRVAPFEEKNRRYFHFQHRNGQLPVQKEGDEVDYRGALHQDGSVFISVSQLKAPELMCKSLATKLIVGMPFKDLATVDSIFLREFPVE